MLYVDQHVRIWLAMDRPLNEVRLTFNETNSESVTLALSIEKAEETAQELARMAAKARATLESLPFLPTGRRT